ncbi:MAG TPA: 2-phosphosulfolactate phosphatase [Gemmatimonadaceae bacterium]|nr:2-phosphosulfolactate phosphatase [Gemmatimonadaceae bacterium]
MRVEVYFSPLGVPSSAFAGKVVAVIDVLRASTTIAAALHNGARHVLPFESSEEAITRVKSFDRKEVVLAGERKMRAIAGFDLGNSPLEFTPEAVEGRTVLLTTSNGTAAITSVQGAREVIIASYVNFTPVVTLMRTATRGGTDVVLLCAGREKGFTLEDAACAGRFVRQLMRGRPTMGLNDAAQAAVLIEKRYGDQIAEVLADAEHGRALREAGFGPDLEVCAQLEAFPVIPIYQDRQITRLDPGRER